MHGERDIITRAVFPELNQRLKDRNIRVVPIDLRWGLTKEDTSDEGLGALEHCLIEIDRSRPFFVMLSGNRYGWIPPNYRVSDTPQYEWVKNFEPGNSITAMEVYHGFLRCPFHPTHAYCYLRNPSFLSQITDPDERNIFVDCFPGSEAAAKKDKLISEIKNHVYIVIYIIYIYIYYIAVL